MPRFMMMGHSNPLVEKRFHGNSRPPMKHGFHESFNCLGRLSLFSAVVLLCWLSVSPISRVLQDIRVSSISQVDAKELWESRFSNGWRASSTADEEWILPSSENNGYLLIRCNGSLNEHRIAISNAVLAAKLMNATLVLPELEANSLWPDEKRSFSDIYDVEHFVKSLETDVEIARTTPRIRTIGIKRKPLRPFLLQPPKEASLDWYGSMAVEKMKEHGAVYLMLDPSNRFLEDIPLEKEYQKLRCRVNFHALRFNEEVRQLSARIVSHLRSDGPFMAIHFPSDMGILSSEGCFSVFAAEELEIVRSLKTTYASGKSNGKCPLTPLEVGLLLQAMGFDNSTRIYVSGSVFAEAALMQPLRSKFHLLETRSSAVASAGGSVEIDISDNSLLGAAVDYMVCLVADIFMLAGDDAAGNSLVGHRLYNGFRTSIQLDPKGLAPRNPSSFKANLRWLLQGLRFGDVHRRGAQESFYSNPWPQCFCKEGSGSPGERCSRRRAASVSGWESVEVAGNGSGIIIL